MMRLIETIVLFNLSMTGGNLGEVPFNALELERGEESIYIVDINCLNDILLVIFLANYHNLFSPHEASIMTTSDA